ncbi:MAG: class I SAM-dependent methyltransferase [Planctomycetaceae bacterium]
MTMNLSSRNRQSELMDDPSLNGSTHRHALASLRRINWLSRIDRTVWKEILRQAKKNSRERPLTILDIAAGGGDLAIRLASLAERDGVSVMIDGCDISPTAQHHWPQRFTMLWHPNDRDVNAG